MAVNGIEIEEGQRWVTRSGDLVSITNVGSTNPRFPWVVRDQKGTAIATLTRDGREFINDDEGHNDLICLAESSPGKIVRELVVEVDRRRPENPVDALSAPMRRRSDWPGVSRKPGEVPDLAASPQDFVASVTGGLEEDPHFGRNLNVPGAKGDAGKMRPGLVLGGFARALREVVKVGTYGAMKYTDNGWMTVTNGIERYDDAKLRHWLDEKCGIDCDKDTQLLHAAHEAWNALARLDLLVRKQEQAQ